MDKITLHFSPMQLARVTGIPIETIFNGLRDGSIFYEKTDEGIKIPVTYKIEKISDTTCHHKKLT